MEKGNKEEKWDGLLCISTILFIITLLLFFAFLLESVFFSDSPKGDEGKYLQDLLTAKEFGFKKAIEGSSLIFLTVSFLVERIINDPLLSLKITNLLFGVFSLFILWYFNEKFLKIKGSLKFQIYMWILYLFVIQTTFFAAISDMVLDFFGFCFFILFILMKKENSSKYFILGFFLALMLATRTMAGTYLIVFFLCLIFLRLLFKNLPIKYKNISVLGLSTIFFLLITNTYSLFEFQSLTFEEKELPASVNWAQWDYHNALLIDQGIQERFHHVEVEKTIAYLAENGQASLPTTFLEMIIFDPVLTIKEFFIDSFTGLKYMLRQTGLIVFLYCFFLLARLKKARQNKKIEPEDIIYFFCVSYFFFICFIVIANIQPRWFMLFLPIMILLIGKDLNAWDINKQKTFAIANNLFFVAMTAPYLYSKLHVFF